MTFETSKRTLGAVFVGSILALPATAAQNAMEEVVVTAQRVEESVQEVPIAVTAFSGETPFRLADNFLRERHFSSSGRTFRTAIRHPPRRARLAA